MQTREKPPIVVAPEVEPLMKGHLLELRDVLVDQSKRAAIRFGLTLDQILIRKFYDPCEEGDDRLIFELCVSGDESKIDEFWDSVVNNTSEHGTKMSKKARVAFDEVVSVFVHW